MGYEALFDLYQAVCGGYASSDTHSKYHPVVPSPTALINSSNLCLHIHIFTLIVECNNGKLISLLVICKICTFSFLGGSRRNYIEGTLEWMYIVRTNLLFSEISQFSNFSSLHFCLRLQLEAWPARPSSARRPSRRSGPTCCCSWGTWIMIMRKRMAIRMINMKSVNYRWRAGPTFWLRWGLRWKEGTPVTSNPPGK